jgi:predicted dehydrogenase
MSARVFHCPLISSSPYLHLSAVVERNSDKSKDVYPWINVFKSTDELFASADIDLVVITTPNGSHYPLALQAMQQGKNVVVEKPFTITSEEANELARVSKETGLICSVYQNRRWDGDFLTVKKLIKGNQLGRLVEFESHFDRFRNFVKAGWREQNDAPGSGMLYDLGAHLIDQGKRSFFYIYI